MNRRAAASTFWALTICATANAQNSNLNAPVSRQPTVRTEIDRGQDAGFECGLNNITSFFKFKDCINDDVDTNRQNSTLSDPFEFGLYVRALQHAYVQGVQLRSEAFLSVWRDRLVKIMETKKLSLAVCGKTLAIARIC